MTAYDFLEVTLRFDSDRDEAQDDVTILGLSLSMHDIHRLYEVQRDLGDRQRKDIQIQYSIPEMIRAADKGDAAWKSLAYIQLFVAEANYPHASRLQFDIKNVRLLRFQSPMISKIDVPKVLMLPQPTLPIRFEIMGTRSIQKGSHRISAVLTHSSGKQHSQMTADLDQNRLLVLDTSDLTPGKYRLDVEITTQDGQPVHQLSETLTTIRGISP